MDLNALTYSINGAAFEVNRVLVLGPGFLEKVYEKTLLMDLKALEMTAADVRR
jgi:GxxExxY protein